MAKTSALGDTQTGGIGMKRIWTLKELKLLRYLYPDHPTNIIAKKLKRNISAVYNAAFVYGVKKSKTFLQGNNSGRFKKLSNAGKRFQFKRGHTPFNKGKKWRDYMSHQAKLSALKTAYRKGHEPHNTKSDLDISVRKDKSGNNYKYIRLKKGKWKPLHVYNWEKKYGKIPKGHIVVFKTRHSTDNCHVKNLELITRQENMSRNTIHRYPAELKQTIRTLNKLKNQIKKDEKE